VRDEGIGIAEEDIPLLFQKFRRVGSSTNEEGAGLGLMITKSIVELMQGTIRLNSRLGEGSLFKVVLPLRKSEALTTKMQSRDPTKSFDTNANVLVVEDNYINQEVAKALFNSIGLLIEVCESGEEAVELAKTTHFDLIFMDLNLPGIDGFEASAKITANNGEQKIVALSADVFAENAPELKKSGILSCLTKPSPKAQLIATLNQYAPSP
jgi:CheY-like chemotaxis protein